MKRKILLFLVVALVLSLALTACVDREVTKITIVDGTFDYEYEKGSTPDFSDLKVKVTYSDGKEREVAADKLTLGTLDTSTTGTKQFTITYDGFTLTVDVQVIYTEPPVVVTLDKIEIDKTSVLSKVKVGDTYSLADIKVTATYSDNTTKALTLADLATAVAPDTAVAGAKKLTVSYTEDDTTVNAEMDVTVVGVKTLTLVDAPAYVMKGETLATSGITASVIYTDETSETLANDKLTFAAFATTEVGAKKLTATYLDGTGEATVAVIEAIGIDISGIGAFTSNIPDGQDIDLAAVKAAATVTVNYGYGTTKVTSAVAADASTLTVTDVEEGGKRYLKFAFGGFEKAIEVLEGAAVIESIAINPLGTKGYVALGKTFDTAGITLTATYTNGTTDTVTAGIVFDTLVTTTAGNVTLTARYDGKTATATVKVLPVTSIAVNGTPNLEVKKGGTLDAAKVDALTFTVTYSDGVDTIVDNSVSIADMTKGAIDTTTAGDKTFTVTYKGANGNVPFEVYTEASVAIVGSVEINKGEPLNVSDLTFKVTYTNGTSENISGALVTLEAGYQDKLAAVGRQTISVTYGDATGSFNVTVKGFIIMETYLPQHVVDFNDSSKTGAFLNHSNLVYVVGDDNPFKFTLRIVAADENGDDYPITNYVSASKVYLGSTLLTGSELARYVTIDETKNTFDFTEEAVGKTFTISTVPASAQSDADLVKSHTVKIVNGWNIHSAKELNILTNCDNIFEGHGSRPYGTQVDFAHNFLTANGIAYPTAPIAGAILHGDFTLTMSDLPQEYFIAPDANVSEYTFYNDSTLLPHSTDYYNADTGRYEFNFYGNYYTIYTYGIPLTNNVSGRGNQYFGTDDGGGVTAVGRVTTSQLFRFYRYNAQEEAAAAGEWNNKNYVVNLHDFRMMDDDPNRPTGDTSTSARSLRGLIGLKVQYIDAHLNNLIIEKYYISMLADCDFLDVEINECKFYNAWQNHIFIFGTNRIQTDSTKAPGEAGSIGGYHGINLNIKNSKITVCGGPIIISQTDVRDDSGNFIRKNMYTKNTVVIDDATEIYTYVNANAAFFAAFGAQQEASLIQGLSQALKAQTGYSYEIGNPLNGYEGKFMNMIMLNMTDGFGASDGSNDVDGSLTVAGTQVLNMNDSGYAAAVAALMGQGYTQAQAEGAILTGQASGVIDASGNVMLDRIWAANPAAPVVQSTAATAGVGTALSTAYFNGTAFEGVTNAQTFDVGAISSSHALCSGEYLTLYYGGMGIVLGDYHNCTAQCTVCK